MNIRRGAHFFTALATVLLLASCSGSDMNNRRAGEGRDWHWDKKAGATEASAFMNVAVPEGATQAKGAVQVNPQEDIYLLSFVTSEKNAEDIAEDLHSEVPLKAQKKDFAPEGERFGHLGLPEPQTLKGVRSTGVCPPCVKDDRRKKVQWIDIYVQAFKADQARVYLQAF
ncbi:hypothetical protein [Streptomyces sp. NPDC051286]|uniref:hypothetical protein n=1 Tax=Streptomyces sp. NPDC051286 TaxID=3365647 RepID=UPI00378993EB